jgi:hypothetical protein
MLEYLELLEKLLSNDVFFAHVGRFTVFALIFIVLIYTSILVIGYTVEYTVKLGVFIYRTILDKLGR